MKQQKIDKLKEDRQKLVNKAFGKSYFDVEKILNQIKRINAEIKFQEKQV